jgi:hypothetical protein
MFGKSLNYLFCDAFL